MCQIQGAHISDSRSFRRDFLGGGMVVSRSAVCSTRRDYFGIGPEKSRLEYGRTTAPVTYGNTESKLKIRAIHRSSRLNRGRNRPSRLFGFLS